MASTKTPLIKISGAATERYSTGNKQQCHLDGSGAVSSAAQAAEPKEKQAAKPKEKQAAQPKQPDVQRGRCASPPRGGIRSGSPPRGGIRSGSPPRGRNGAYLSPADVLTTLQTFAKVMRNGSPPPRPHGRSGSPPRLHGRSGSPPRPHGRSGSPPRLHGRSGSPPPRPHGRSGSPPRPHGRSGSPPRPHGRSGSPPRGRNGSPRRERSPSPGAHRDGPRSTHRDRAPTALPEDVELESYCSLGLSCPHSTQPTKCSLNHLAPVAGNVYKAGTRTDKVHVCIYDLKWKLGMSSERCNSFKCSQIPHMKGHAEFIRAKVAAINEASAKNAAAVLS